jgi:hypothetical protein
MATKKKTAATVDQPKAAEPKFTKEQLVKSKAFSQHKDTLNAILEAGKTYTKEQAERLVSEFLERKV